MQSVSASTDSHGTQKLSEDYDISEPHVSGEERSSVCVFTPVRKIAYSVTLTSSPTLLMLFLL